MGAVRGSRVSRRSAAHQALPNRYETAVLRESTLLRHWRMDGAFPLVETKGGPSLAASGSGCTASQAGPTKTQKLAAQFDGIAGVASCALDLTAYNTLTVEFLMKWNAAYNNTDRVNIIFGWYAQGAFGIDCDSASGYFYTVLGNYNDANFAKPSTGAWHHYAFLYDLTASGAAQIDVYVDGALVTMANRPHAATQPGPFANTSLTIGGSAGLGKWGPCSIQQLAIYNGLQSAGKIAARAALAV